MNTFVERYGDRVNPILVKEVRAALRGRWFRISFAIVLVLATIASMGYVVLGAPNDGDTPGPAYFAIVLGCMSLALHGLVPFSAMLSMNAESDEHTLELLQISGIPTARIVVGKLFAALIQAGLVLSAFLPFLTFAFLLRGVGVGQIVMTLAGSVGACAAQCSFGILLGSLAKARWARVVLMFVFALMLLQTSGWGVLLVMAIAVGPAAVGPATAAVTVSMLVFFALSAFFAVMAATRLAHPEENQSTPVRVCVTLVLAAGLVFAAFQSDLMAASVVAGVTLGFVALPLLFIVTERERLPRAVSAHLPRWSRFPPFQAWLPGGGRGALFLVVNLALFVAGFALLVAARFASAGHARASVGEFATVALLAIVFFGLPSAALARFTSTFAGRIVPRISILAFLLLSGLLPVFWGFMIGESGLEKWVLVTIPFNFDSSGQPAAWGPVYLLCGLAAFTVLGNVPRILQSFSEVRAARQREIAKESARAATQS